MRPLDPRLLRVSAPARRWVILSAVGTVCLAVLTVVVAIQLAQIIAAVVLTGVRDWTHVWLHLAIVVAALGLRSGLVAVQGWLGDRAATAVTHDVRQRSLVALCDQPHGGQAAAVPSVVLADGLDQMGPYVSRFLPTLVASMIVTPGLVAVTFYYDPVSALIQVGTLPLVPLFMALVGWATASAAAKRLQVSQKLADQLIDLLAGLPTLRYARRATAQQSQVLRTAQRYQKATSSVLKQAFLSSLVLEVLTTLAVALVAVGIGVRLISGSMELVPGLTVLILAPEVFLPLRLVGQHFHASADGVAATKAALDVAEGAKRPEGTHHVGAVRKIEWRDVSVVHQDRSVTAPRGFCGVATAGEVTALVGASGCGKSTTVHATLQLLNPSAGEIVIVDDAGERLVGQVDRTVWHQRIAWLPQRPSITVGTVADNLWLPAGQQLRESERAEIACQAGLAEVLDELPDGWNTVVGRGGFGLSAGQRHRVACARALARVRCGASVLIVDEPTAHLDRATEDVIATSLRTCADAGVVVIVVAHRESLVAAADVVLPVSGEVSA